METIITAAVIILIALWLKKAQNSWPNFKTKNLGPTPLPSGIWFLKVIVEHDEIDITVKDSFTQHTLYSLWNGKNVNIDNNIIIGAWRSQDNKIFITTINTENEWEQINNILRNNCEIPLFIKKKQWWIMTIKNGKECNIKKITQL